MIVKNEGKNLPRLLASVADHIACYAIVDTGSTDGTPDLIHDFFVHRTIPGLISHAEFHNFSQARNIALKAAWDLTADYDYLLLLDADMELVAEGPTPNLTAPAYKLVQKATNLAYRNIRLLRRDAPARYIGATHEYLAVEGVADLGGWWCRDHADGANRGEKFDRDLRLLTEAIREDPNDERSWYYFSQTLRDLGKPKEAADAYLHRASLGGWVEEVWSARLNAARCLRDSGDVGGFLREALCAFGERPTRAEPMADLARYYREHGKNEAALVFADAGKRIPYPNDSLFVESDVYSWALDKEIAIAGNYVPARFEEGHEACERLALRRDIPAAERSLARYNLFWYYQPLSVLAPGFRMQRVDFEPPDGWYAMNPSITTHDGALWMTQRCVNYGEGYVTPNGDPITTRNWLLGLSDELAVKESYELKLPDLPPPAFPDVRGFEDLRLFSWRDGFLWASATVREITPEGWAEQLICRIWGDTLRDWEVLHPSGPKVHEKNWCPAVDGDQLRFIYLCDPTRILDEHAKTLLTDVPSIAAENFRGGSQAIPFDDGWLCVIHEQHWHPQRYYRHRFVWFDRDWHLSRVSQAFYLREKAVEYVAGLTARGSELLLSFGVRDQESWIGIVPADEVRALLRAG